MRLLGLVLLLGFSNMLFGQKFLQIEKRGSLKVVKYYIGDDINYRLKGDKTWYTGTIQDLIIDENIILFANRYIRMDDVQTLRKRKKWSGSVGRQLYYFAGSWLFFSAAGTLVGWELRWDTVIIPATAVVVGWLIKKIFKYKKYKIGKKHRLRMLDLNLKKPIFGP